MPHNRKAIAIALASYYFPLTILFTAGAPAADGLTPGRSFRDCPVCPDMVVVPAGSFSMGAAPAQTDRQPVGRFEVTAGRRRTGLVGGGRIARTPEARPR